MVKFTDYISKPLFDDLVKKKIYIVQITIGEYLKLIDLKENPYQRNVLDYDIYQKLIRDILSGAIFPPISVVCKEEIDLEKGLNENSKLMVLDGLQRTNCLLVCKEILEGSIKLEELDPKYKSVGEFLDRKITLEIWENLDLRSILYKIIVLNTGQRRMDARHQLDIMISSLKDFLKREGIKFIELKEKIAEDRGPKELQESNTFPLYTIAEAIVAYISRYPKFTQSSTTEFLFDKSDLEPGIYNEGIKIIEDESTYKDISWCLKELSDLLLKKYKYNIFIKYPLFLASFMAAMGYCKSEFGKNQLSSKKGVLIDLLKKEESDPLDINSYLKYYKEFDTGIGAKRRKMVFIAFRNFFASPVINKVEWYQAFKEVK